MANVNNAGVLPEFDLSIIVLLVILLLLGIFPDDIREYIEKDEEDNDELRPITYNDFVLAAKEVCS